MGETTELWSDEDLCEVVRRELRLLEPECRSRPAAVLALLHPDFLEFGASGRRWDAASIAELLAQENSAVVSRASNLVPVASRASDLVPVASQASDLVPVRLARDVVLLTYTAHRPERVSLRSSVWVRHPEQGWVLRFAQGTTVSSPTA
jgi:hypothetical protein